MDLIISGTWRNRKTKRLARAVAYSETYVYYRYIDVRVSRGRGVMKPHTQNQLASAAWFKERFERVDDNE